MDIPKLLKEAFEAGENYANSGEFAFYAPSFKEWYNPELAAKVEEEGKLLVRFIIRQWTSFNEQNEPDHEQLVEHFFETELAEYYEKRKQINNELKG